MFVPYHLLLFGVPLCPYRNGPCSCPGFINVTEIQNSGLVYRVIFTRLLVDLNECGADGPSRCGANTDCVNTPGSHECQCKTGKKSIRNKVTSQSNVISINKVRCMSALHLMKT